CTTSYWYIVFFFTTLLPPRPTLFPYTTLFRSNATELEEAGMPLRRDAGRKTLAEWLRFSGASLANLRPWLDSNLDLASELAVEMAEDAAYAPYLERQEGGVRGLRASQNVCQGPNFPYREVPGLANEMVERLTTAQPNGLAAAGGVRGVTPAALAAVLVVARRQATVA